MASTATLTVNDGLGIVRIGRAHGNAINEELLGDLTAAFDQAAARDDVRGLLLASTGKLFSPGLDLVELVEYDRAAMERFATTFAGCIRTMYAYPGPLVAALHGHAIAGGCVISLAADWRILREGAMVGLNEVRVGVSLPYGVAMILRESVPTRHLEEIALFGRNYKDDEAVSAGLVHELHAAEGFEAHCLSRLADLASRDARAFSITKRYLRETTLERIVAREPELAAEFLDSWFAPETRARIQAIVADLSKSQRPG